MIEALDTATTRIGRYVLHRQIARGGMATIHIARLTGEGGFSRIVAAKRLLPELASLPEVAAMFLDEARIASRIHHRNVVPVLDVVRSGNDIILVQDYVHGVSLSALLAVIRQTRAHVPTAIAVSIASQVLAGLQAAHETVDELGRPLHVVHRDVSPQNIMIAIDGTARLLDFGIAKAVMAAHVTREQVFKGKLAYCSAEQLQGAATLQSDIYALGVVLWELVVGRHVHAETESESEIVTRVLQGRIPTIVDGLVSERAYIPLHRWRDIEAIDPIVRRALATSPAERWQTAAEMEVSLVAAVTPSSSTELRAWLKSLGHELLAENERILADEEASWRRSSTAPTPTLLAAPTQTPEPPKVTTPDAMPGVVVPTHRRWLTITAVASALLAVAIVVWLVARIDRTTASAATSTTSRDTAAPGTTRDAPTSGGGATVRDTTSGSGARVRDTTSADSATAPAGSATPPSIAEAIVDHLAAAPARPNQTAAATPPRRQPGRVLTHPLAPQPHATPTPPPAVVTTTTTPAPDCDPPYYFEGTRKIFKSECL